MTISEKALVLLGAIAVLICMIATEIVPPAMQLSLSDFQWTLSSGLACYLAWLGFRKSTHADKSYKLWIFNAFFAYLIGQILWDIQTLEHARAFPAPSDAFYLLMGPLLVIGFIKALKNQLSSSKTFAFYVDAFSLTAALLGYVLVLYLPESGKATGWQLAVLTAYPVGILSATCVVALVILYIKPAFTRYWALFIGGLVIEGGVWMQWNLNELSGLNLDNSLLNKLFSMADIMLGFGAYGIGLQSSKTPKHYLIFKQTQKFVPLIALFIAIGTILLITIRSGSHPYSFYVAVSSVTLILFFAALRQSVLLNESERLFLAQSAIAEKERQYQYLALHDPLTGLPNRWQIQTRFEQAILTAKSQASSVAILIIDINRFKVVNDSHGHEVGDKILIEVANRLRKVADDVCPLGRLGGDKFAMLVESRTADNELAHKLQAIIKSIHELITINGHEFVLEAAIGISMFPRDSKRANELILKAETALYESKKQSHSHYVFYSPKFTQQAKNRLELDINLRKAIDLNEFYLEFQPIYTTKTKRIHSLEALVRWKTASGSIIGPDEFIPFSEEIGLIHPIGDLVIKQAFAALAHINQNIKQPINMAINISPKQFKNTKLVNLIAEYLEKYRLHPKLITLEITETAVFDHTEEAAETVTRFKSLGVQLALDDFGAGHSSLFKLKKLPIDELKVDRAFLANVPNDEADNEILNTIAKAAKALDLTLIVEGVENQAQYEFLSKIGCQNVQGFLFSKPVGLEQAVSLINAQN